MLTAEEVIIITTVAGAVMVCVSTAHVAAVIMAVEAMVIALMRVITQEIMAPNICVAETEVGQERRNSAAINKYYNLALLI